MRRILLSLLLFAGFAGGVLDAQQPARRPAQPTAPAPPPAPQSAREFPIDSIAIEGNKILPTAGIVSASGLKAGQPGSGPIFDAARDRLLATGYFDMVAYQYKPAEKGGYNVTFEVQEIETMYPFRVDALPATAEEIAAYLKTRDPLFVGKMPGTGAVIRRTAGEIEKYLEGRGHPAKVTGKMVALTAKDFEIQFMPSTGLPVVSDVSFAGSKAINAADLHKQISEVAFGQPYSESGFRVLLDNQIRPMYEAKGYMDVKFPKITTSPSTDVTGLDVKVTVDEGVEYKLTRVAIAGRSQSESVKILRSAKLPKLTVANFEEVKEAAKRVQESMRHQGYLDARTTTEKQVNEQDKSVAFFINVDTGDLYTFGKLTVNGLGLDGEAAIRKMWSVKSGEPYPDNYPDYFLGRVKEEGLFDNLGATTSQKKINPDTKVVDVTLDFKGAPQQKPKKPQDPGGFGIPPI
jgi:outer membrane protein insertion porin family